MASKCRPNDGHFAIAGIDNGYQEYAVSIELWRGDFTRILIKGGDLLSVVHI